MFKLAVEPTFWHPVQLSRPGSAEVVTISVEYVHKTRTEMREFFVRQAEMLAGAPGMVSTPAQDAEVLSQVMRNWKEVDLPFSKDALTQLLERFPASGVELFNAYRTALLGSRAKN